MALMDFLFSDKTQSSARVAKNRLQIILSSGRSDVQQPDYFPQLQQELLEVIRRYVHIQEQDVRILMGRQDDLNVLEFNAVLPEEAVPDSVSLSEK